MLCFSISANGKQFYTTSSPTIFSQVEFAPLIFESLNEEKIVNL